MAKTTRKQPSKKDRKVRKGKDGGNKYVNLVRNPCRGDVVPVPYGLRPHYSWRRSTFMPITVPTATVGIDGSAQTGLNPSPNVICWLDPWGGVMSANAYVGTQGAMATAGTSVSTQIGKYLTSRTLQAFVAGTYGRVRVSAACLRLVCTAPETARSGAVFAGTDMMSQTCNLRTMVGDATATPVAYNSTNSNSSEIPYSSLAMASLATRGKLLPPKLDAEAVVNMAAAEDELMEYNLTTGSGLSAINVEARDRPVAWCGVMGATPGATYVLEAIVCYDWIPAGVGDQLEGGFADISKGSAPTTWETVRHWFSKIQDAYTWGHAIKQAGTALLAG